MSSRFGCVVYANPMQDMGDFWSLMLLADLHQKELTLEGCISHTEPAHHRAHVAAGFFAALGLSSVRIAVGQNTLSETSRSGESHSFADVPFLDTEAKVSFGKQMMIRCLQKTARYYPQHKQKIKVVLLSKLSEFATFLLEQRGKRLLYSGDECLIGEVIMVSDLQRDSSGSVLLVDESGNPLGREGQTLYRDLEPYTGKAFVVPCKNAANNVDLSSQDSLWRAGQCFRLLQELGVKITIITKAAAKKATMPISLYSQLAESGDSLALWLAEHNADSLLPLWKECFLPKHSPDRRLLLAGQEQEWFCNCFLQGQGRELTANDDFRPLYSKLGQFMPYGALAALAASSARNRLFEPEALTGIDSAIEIIGEQAIRSAEEIKGEILNRARRALTQFPKQPAVTSNP